jgi:hypothetical protein
MNFTPPAGYEESFTAWRKAVGQAAYESWLKAAKSWVGLNGEVHIKAASVFKASWIRNHYINFLEKVLQCPVVVSSPEDVVIVKYWPHGGPVGGSAFAWFHINERWPGDKLE